MKKEKTLFDEIKKDAWDKTVAPTFKDIIDFYQHFGLCGEEENAVLFTVSFAGGTSLGIISLSGSGKSVLSNIFFDWLYPKDLLYVAGRGSKTAIISDFKAINDCKGIYIEELQKIVNNDDDKEMLKNLLEGKKYERRKREETIKANIVQHIEPKPVAFTIAIENEHKDYNEAEFSRRPFLSLTTDISPETTRKVLNYKLKSRFKSNRLNKVEPKVADKIRFHVKNMITLGNYKCENPFAEYFDNILDSSYLRMRSLLDVYLNVMDSSAKWFLNNRLKDEVSFSDTAEMKYDGKVFLEIQDIINGHELYAKQFHRSVLQVPMLGKKILGIFDKAKGAKKSAGQMALVEYEDDTEYTRKMMTIDMIHRELKKEKTILNHAVIRQTCELLCEGNYLEKEKVSSKTFYLKTFDVEEFEDKMNYKDCWEFGCQMMKEHYPEYFIDWYNKQIGKDGVVKLTNPITGEMFKFKVNEKITETTPEENIMNDINNGKNEDIDLLEKYGEKILMEFESTGKIYRKDGKWMEMK